MLRRPCLLVGIGARVMRVACSQTYMLASRLQRLGHWPALRSTKLSRPFVSSARWSPFQTFGESGETMPELLELITALLLFASAVYAIAG